jgi:hypothetical protein
LVRVCASICCFKQRRSSKVSDLMSRSPLALAGVLVFDSGCREAVAFAIGVLRIWMSGFPPT